MKRVKVRHPGISVKLIKNVGRSLLSGTATVSSRFSGQNKVISLERYLGDQGNVRVTKSVREPAGSFSITFSDRINIDAFDTVYGLIEPMDLVEIRMAGTSASESRQVPVMMRGFVSSIRRTETMGNDGRPQRAIVVSGQDYGKIWQILQVFFMPNAPDSGNLITSFPFFARFGLSMKTMRADEFVREVFEKVVNPYIVEMGAQDGNPNDSALRTITPDIQISDGVVSPFGAGAWQGGTIHSLLHEHCDVGPWNELYIEDRDSGPFVVYRPNPFKTADGRSYVQPVLDGKEPITTVIGRDEIVSMSVERTDANVANYFWVDAPRFALNYSETLRAMTYQGDPGSFFVEDYGNVNPKLYGTRKMFESTQQGGNDETDSGNGTKAGSGRTAGYNNAVEWINARRQALVDQNKDNVIFEIGTMRVKGNENIRAGSYVRVNNGMMTPEFYGVTVQHDYLPFQGYFTTINFERGTGFIDRAMQGGGAASPYWQEMTGNDR